MEVAPSEPGVPVGVDVAETEVLGTEEVEVSDAGVDTELVSEVVVVESSVVLDVESSVVLEVVLVVEIVVSEFP